MADENQHSPPKPTSGDHAHAIVRAGLGAIPVVGTAAIELFNAVIAPPLANRRDKWMEAVAFGLEDLARKIDGFSIDALKDNDAFISAVMHASQVAIRSHQAEKHQALRNAVLNVASGNAPDEDRQWMFLHFVDTLTPWHLRVLKFFEDPASCADVSNIGMGGLSNVIERAFPDLRGQREFYDVVFEDLITRGLISKVGLHVTMSGHGLTQKRTTKMGDEFLAFISSPIPENDGD